jgi:hypothetical protein
LAQSLVIRRNDAPISQSADTIIVCSPCHAFMPLIICGAFFDGMAYAIPVTTECHRSLDALSSLFITITHISTPQQNAISWSVIDFLF